MVMQRAPHRASLWGYHPDPGSRIIVQVGITVLGLFSVLCLRLHFREYLGGATVPTHIYTLQVLQVQQWEYCKQKRDFSPMCTLCYKYTRCILKKYGRDLYFCYV